MDKYVSQQYTVLKCIVGLLVSEDTARYKQGNRICLIFSLKKLSICFIILIFRLNMKVDPPPQAILISKAKVHSPITVKRLINKQT